MKLHHCIAGVAWVMAFLSNFVLAANTPNSRPILGFACAGFFMAAAAYYRVGNH